MGKKPKDRDLVPYMAVWGELMVIKELVCRGEMMIIPEGRCTKNDVAMRDWVMDLGHSAHQGVDATRRQLRVRLWFPGMDKAVERRVSTCLACQASVESKARDPLKPPRIQVQDGGGERDDDGDADTDADDGDGGDTDQDGAAAAEGGQEQEGARPDIQERLRMAPEVIVTETWANRAQRTRQPRVIFQAGTKKVGKKPGRGRKDR